MKRIEPFEHTHQRPAFTCPDCGVLHCAASGLNVSNAPKPGDVSVCIACAGVHIFEADRLRPLTEEEALDVLPDPRIQLMRDAVLKTLRSKET